MNKPSPLIALVGIAAFLLLASTGLAQSPPPDAEIHGAEVIRSKPLWTYLAHGGWAMLPIGICFGTTIFLIYDGKIRTSRARVAPAGPEQSVKALFRQGDYAGAYNFCKENPSPLLNVLRVGISLIGDGQQATDERMAAELARESAKMRTYVRYLALISICAPIIGFLGTITGLINAFNILATAENGTNPAFPIAIAESFVPMGFGLVLAILALTAFYVLRNRAANSTRHIRNEVGSVFRKMPYEAVAGVQIGDEELYAPSPNWTGQSEDGATTPSVPSRTTTPTKS